MSEKRFYYEFGNDGYYIIDKEKIEEYDESFTDKMEYREYTIENSLSGDEVVDLLNNQAETINKQLKRIQELSDDRKVMEKHELRRLIEISNSQTLRIYAQDMEIQKLLTQIEELKQSKNKEV